MPIEWTARDKCCWKLFFKGLWKVRLRLEGGVGIFEARKILQREKAFDLEPCNMNIEHSKSELIRTCSVLIFMKKEKHYISEP